MTKTTRDEEFQTRIERLIEAEPDNHERAKLLIILQLFHCISDTISTVNDIATEIGKHREEYAEHVRAQNQILDRGWGLWKVVSVIALAVQILVGGALSWFWEDRQHTNLQIAEITKNISTLEMKIPSLAHPPSITVPPK